MDLQLKDRVVLVVGGAGLIGTAVVRQLREEGATVVVASRSVDEGEGQVRLDAADDASVATAVAGILETHGRIDGLVVTAAPAAHTLDPARNSDPAQVLEAFQAKALVFLRVTNAVVPVMREAGYGRVVVVSGQNAFLTGNLTGSVRNAATVVMAENLADELAGTGVAVNAVNPAAVTEEPQSSVQPGKGGDSTPGQVADLVTFLVSPVSAVSGESVAVGHRVLGVTSL